MTNKEALEYCSKCLFTASENIRECLDTIDLEKLPVDFVITQSLENALSFLEGTAQSLQKKARF